MACQPLLRRLEGLLAKVCTSSHRIGDMNRAYLKAWASDCASASLQFVRRQPLRGQLPLGRRVRGQLLACLERIYPAPPQGDHMEAMVEVRSVAVEQRCGAVPLRKHGRMPRPAHHPDVVDLEMDIGQDAPEAFKPAAQGFIVVALTTERVGTTKAVMNIPRDWSKTGPSKILMASSMAIDVNYRSSHNGRSLLAGA